MAEQISQQLPATKNLHDSLSRAEELATRRKHSVVGLDHLLLALGQDPEAVTILVACNVDVEALCMDLLRKLGPEARMLSPNTVPPTFDVTVQNLIAHASAAAIQSGYSEIDGSNILSAIISGEGGMISHKILQRHGLTFNETVKNLTAINQRTPDSKVARKTDSGDDAAIGKEAAQSADAAQHQGTENGKAEEHAGQISAGNQDQSLNRGLKDDELLKASGPDITDDILGDSIVQAEAHPSDYGIADDGSEDFPIPPQRQSPQNKQNQIKDAQFLPKNTIPSHQGQSHQGQTHQGLSHQGQSHQGAAHPPQKTGQPDQMRQQHLPPAPEQGDERQKTPPAGAMPPKGAKGQKISFQNSSFNPVPFQMPDGAQGKKEEKAGDQQLPAKETGGPPNQRPPVNQLPQQGTPHNAAMQPPIPAGQHRGQSQFQPPLPDAMRQKGPLQEEIQRPPLRQLGDAPVQPAPLPPTAPPIRQVEGDPGQQPMQNLDDLAASMKQAQTNLEHASQNDQVIENIPKVMRVGKVHFVEIRVARFTNTELDFGPENYGLRSKPDAGPITKAITVRLTGPDGQFLIDCATASTQWSEIHPRMVDDVDFIIWRWRIMPRKRGISKLRLDITCRTSNNDGLSAEIPIQPSKSIDIKITRNYLSGLKKLLMIGVIFAAGYGIANYGETAYKFTMSKIEALKETDN